MKNPLSACRGQIIACIMGALIFTLLLLPLCCHAQSVTNPSTLADGIFHIEAVDTIYQVHGDTLFITETWQSGWRTGFAYATNPPTYEMQQPKYIRRRSLYLIKFLKDQEPRTIEVQETITRPVEVWVDHK